MSQQEMVPNSEDFQYLWLENPIAQEQLQKIILQRLLRESRSNNVEGSVVEDGKEEPSKPLFIPPTETSGHNSGILKPIRVYIGELLIKLGKRIQGI